jgi:L-asparaginase
MSKANLLIVSLGGTIAMTKHDGENGVKPTLDAADLISAVPELGKDFDIETLAFRQIPSSNIMLDDIIELNEVVAHALKNGTDGVVVTQGTDTLAETAFALDLLLDCSKPVVVTGAMRHPALPSADGPANLLAAARVAGSSEALNTGVLAVLADTIHAAQFVTKTHTSNVAAFTSPAAGPIGWVTEGRVRLLSRPACRKHISIKKNQKHQPVALLPLLNPDDIAVFENIQLTGCKGLVIETLGGGHVPEGGVDILAELALEMPVVFASRAGSGEILRETYGYKGAEIDLISRGLIPAGFLNGTKARILLSLLLRKGAGQGEITEFFAWK